MALWLIRGGKYGEHEDQFLDDSRVYLTWDGLQEDLSKYSSRGEIKEVLARYYPHMPEKIPNYSAQVWTFVGRMQPGDLFVLPRKKAAVIAVGKILSDYQFKASAENPYYHFRSVEWIDQEVPRSRFEQDLLFSFGAAQTICQIKRNRSEERMQWKVENGWDSSMLPGPEVSEAELTEATDESEDLVDLERFAQDQISNLIGTRFKGHKMTRLVAAILEAQGYSTYVSDAGPDKGVDILAAPGELGFGKPRICVQVKSGSAPIERTVLDQLNGVMTNVGADQGLLVSWGGFRRSYDPEARSQFFRIRLWDADQLVEELLDQYDRLPEDLKAELPLKRIWVIAGQEDSS